MKMNRRVGWGQRGRGVRVTGRRCHRARRPEGEKVLPCERPEGSRAEAPTSWGVRTCWCGWAGVGEAREKGCAQRRWVRLPSAQPHPFHAPAGSGAPKLPPGGCVDSFGHTRAAKNTTGKDPAAGLPLSALRALGTRFGNHGRILASPALHFSAPILLISSHAPPF